MFLYIALLINVFHVQAVEVNPKVPDDPADKKKKDPWHKTDEDYLRRKPRPQDYLHPSVCSADGPTWVDYMDLPNDKMKITTLPSGMRFKLVEQGSDVRPSATSAVMVKYTGLLIKKRNSGKESRQFGKIMVPQGGQKLTIEQPVESATHANALLTEIAHHLGFKEQKFDDQLSAEFNDLFRSQREGSVWKIHIPEVTFNSGVRTMYGKTDLIFTLESKAIINNKIHDSVKKVEEPEHTTDKDEL